MGGRLPVLSALAVWLAASASTIAGEVPAVAGSGPQGHIRGAASPARHYVLSQESATVTLDEPLVTDGAVEVCMGTFVLGTDDAIPAAVPVIVRPGRTLDLGGRRVRAGKLVMDCGTITGRTTLACDSVDWYGGTVAPESRIVYRGQFRKLSGSMTDLPANITCSP